MFHNSALCSAVTSQGTFGTQSGNFLSGHRVSQTNEWHIQYTAGASYSVTNWRRPVSCADSAERNMIQRAIDDFHQRTPVRFKQYNPQTDSDYVNITGQNSGCWSFIGRMRGVSNRVHGVVKTSPALRTAALSFRSPPKLKSTPVYLVL